MRTEVHYTVVFGVDVKVVLSATSRVLCACVNTFRLEVRVGEALGRDGGDALKPNRLFNRLLKAQEIYFIMKQFIFTQLFPT